MCYVPKLENVRWIYVCVCLFTIVCVQGSCLVMGVMQSWNWLTGSAILAKCSYSTFYPVRTLMWWLFLCSMFVIYLLLHFVVGFVVIFHVLFLFGLSTIYGYEVINFRRIIIPIQQINECLFVSGNKLDSDKTTWTINCLLIARFMMNVPTPLIGQLSKIQRWRHTVRNVCSQKWCLASVVYHMFLKLWVKNGVMYSKNEQDERAWRDPDTDRLEWNWRAELVMEGSASAR